MLLGYELAEEVWKEAESVNGRRRGVVTDSADTTDAAPAVHTRACGCCRWRWGCVVAVSSAYVSCAGSCATCVGTPAKWSCLSCAIVGCPLGLGSVAVSFVRASRCSDEAGSQDSLRARSGATDNASAGCDKREVVQWDRGYSHRGGTC